MLIDWTENKTFSISLDLRQVLQFEAAVSYF